MEKVKRIKKSKNNKVETPANEPIIEETSIINNGLDVKFVKKAKKAVIPTKAHATDAGFDMVAVSQTYINGFIEYDTGIAAAIPEGYVGLLFPRSSISKYDLAMANSVGVLDSSYRGNIKFRFKPTKPSSSLEIKKCLWWSKVQEIPNQLNIYQVGDKIGQLVIMKLPEINLVQVDCLDDTERGDGGFGSTGN